MKSPYTLQTLNNGLRVVIETMPDVTSAAAGFLVRTGARDETPEQAGVSHFLEHMCFKGTAKRDWHEISVDFDKLGSMYNAFTSEDRTFYYGWVPRDRIEPQIELLADMMRPELPSDDFNTEKKVILEEIAMAMDSLDHVAFDFLLERVFDGHPLAWPVLGYENTVSELSRDTMHAYMRRRYAPDNMMLIAAGNVDPSEILACAERYCGSWRPAGNGHARAKPTIRSGAATRVLDRFSQQLVVLAYPGPSADDPMHESAQAASAILGGGNSRFFWNIVQTGISSRASSYRMELGDCGLTLLFGQTDPEGAERLTEAMRKEALDLCRGRVRDEEVQRVKNRRRTNLAVEGESPYHRLVQIMDDVDYRRNPRTLDERLAAVNAVTAESIAECLELYPIHGHEYLISVGPRNWPEAR